MIFSLSPVFLRSLQKFGYNARVTFAIHENLLKISILTWANSRKNKIWQLQLVCNFSISQDPNRKSLKKKCDKRFLFQHFCITLVMFKNWTTRAMLILTYLSKLFRGRQIGSQVQARIAWRRKVQTIIVKGSWSKWPLDKLQTQDLVFVGPHFRLEHQAMKFIYTFTQM